MEPEATSEPAVSVVIPALDAARTIRRTLEGLADQDVGVPYEVIVVDDGSRDETLAIAAEHAPLVRVVANSQNPGPGGARNSGVAAARAPVIAFTDSDCFPTRGWLAAGLSALEGADLVQGAVEPDPGAERTPFDRTLVVRADRGFYPTANVFVRRSWFAELGGFEDWIVGGGGDGPFGWRAPTDGRPVVPARPTIGEDTLFGWRLRRRGGLVTFAPAALVHHAVFPGTARGWVRYTWRWKRHVPALAKRIPELRRENFFAGYFVDRRSAAFDLAFVSVVAAVAGGRRTALLGAVPYIWVARGIAGWGPRRAPAAAAGYVAADAAGLGALLVGSLAWRAPVL